MTGIRARIDLPRRGYGRSLGHRIDLLSGEAFAKQEGNWIEVEEKEPSVFAVVDDNMTVKGGNRVSDETYLGFTHWDDEVEDLDGDGNAQCIGISSHLKWKDVDLTPEEFRAPSVERLKEALNHVAICAWCHGDI